MPTLEDAISVVRSGNREEGRRMLEEILETDESNEEVWLWLSSVVDTDEDREICLENVLALNPDNVVAQRGLEALRSGTFNVNMMGQVEGAKEEETEPTTFLDEFTRVEDTGEDEELVWPGKVKSPKKAAKTALNIRTIILAGLGLCIVLGLAAALVYNLFLGGGNIETPQPGQPAQTTPAQGQPETLATDTPIPPTDTPTPTKTPFQLPTAKPTEAPTPTGTTVVSPTPRVGR